jgi:hypothetical protein
MRPAILAGAVLFLSSTAAAQEAPRAEPQPTTREQARDVATQPLTDVGLRRQEIPPLLVAIGDDPYQVDGLNGCPQIAAAVAELDAVLGPDFDHPSEDEDRDRAANLGLVVAGEVVGSLVPFRGLVRHVSGANARETRRQQAYFAGAVRRAFLKGYGNARRCPPPAAPAPRPAVAPTPPATPAR